MSFFQLLQSKKKSAAIVFHIFRVSKKDSSVHIFAESSDDIAFYSAFIKRRGRALKTYDCDNRANVLELQRLISSKSSRFSDCIFLIDKDLEDFLGRRVSTSVTKRIFVTKYYSMDSYICDGKIFDIHCCEMGGVHPFDRNYLDLKRDLESASRNLFRALRAICVAVFAARHAGIQCNLNNFSVLSIVNQANLVVRKRYLETFDSSTKSDLRKLGAKSVLKSYKQVRGIDAPYWFRGKYLLEWYLIVLRYLNDQARSKGLLRGHLGKPARLPDYANARDLLLTVSPRWPEPADLSDFLDKTI